MKKHRQFLDSFVRSLHQGILNDHEQLAILEREWNLCFNDRMVYFYEKGEKYDMQKTLTSCDLFVELFRSKFS